MTNVLSSFCILDISPLSDVGLVKIFSHSVGRRFVLLTMSFALQKLFSVRRSHLLILFLSVSVLLGLYWGSGFLCQCVQVHLILFLILILLFLNCEWSQLIELSDIFVAVVIIIICLFVFYPLFSYIGVPCVSLFALELTL